MIYKGFQILTPALYGSLSFGFLSEAVDMRKGSQTFGDTFPFGSGWGTKARAIRVAKKRIEKILREEKEQ